MPEEDFLAEVKRRRAGDTSVRPAALEMVGGTDAADEDANSIEGKNRVGQWLEFRPLRGTYKLLSYGELVQVEYDPHFGFIVLIFRHVMVKIRGRNLESVLSGLRPRLLHVIAQDDPQRLADDGKPFVEKIEFIYQRLGESMAQSDAAAKGANAMPSSSSAAE
jgi:hypothetical protein